MKSSSEKLKIMVLYDLDCEPDNRPGHERWFMVGEDFRDERHVIKALKRNGHVVEPFGIYDDLSPLLDKIRTSPPDLVFNMCESFSSDRRNEAAVMGFLEMHGIPHTGATAEALILCKDKALSKKIVAFHGVEIPKFEVVNCTNGRGSVQAHLKAMPWPAICKPLDRDSSEGITRSSVVDNVDECWTMIQKLGKKFSGPVIVEEFIAGREIYVGIIEDHRTGKLHIFPPRELHTGTGPNFVTWRSKWDKNYRKKHKITSGPAHALNNQQRTSIERVARESFRSLGLSGYARLDLRIRANGQPVFLEANPNPSIHRNDDFACAASAYGIQYDDLIQKIVTNAMNKQRNKVPLVAA